MLERVTANDETATIVAIHAASGTQVAQDQMIFEFENSKTTQELHAPAAGVLVHALTMGETVQFGVPLARIVTTAPAAPLADVAPPPPPPAPPAQVLAPAPAPSPVPRFSAAAQALIDGLGLKASEFSKAFVTSADVRGRGRPAPAAPRAAAAPAPAPAPVPAGGTPVNFRKRAEIEALSQGAGASMLSVLGVRLGAVAVARPKGDFFDGRITDLVIYEAARLMKKYPRLNAYYEQGHVAEHAAIHAGLAIDGGGRLVVFGVEHANTLTLAELSAVMVDAVARYAEDRLSPRELTRATFTVTDLSADELDFVLPLLPRGQSCILGITQDRESGFRLFAGFDHRVSEGREVGAFLRELRDRVRSFAAATPAAVAAPVCGFCARPAAEVVRKSKDKGLLVVKDAGGRETLCCASCWNGW